MRAPIPEDDEARVAALHRYGVLDQPPAPDFEAITRVATLITGAPMSVVNLIDRDRQFQAAATGMAVSECSRDDSMCAQVIVSPELVHVPDCRLDERFADNPFVVGPIGDLRMYAGVPLVTPDGHAVGTLCVVDDRVRTLAEPQLDALQDLAGQVVQLLEMRRHSDRLASVLGQLAHQAHHDGLTGLANRDAIHDRLTLLCRSTRAEEADGHVGAVLFVDLDGFKGVNDSLGHDAGDQVLVACAARLETACRAGDLVGRLGGDEFVVVAPGRSPAAAEALAGRIRAAVAEPVWTAAGAAAVGASIGVVEVNAGDDPAAVLQRADARMYQAKRARKAAAAG